VGMFRVFAELACAVVEVDAALGGAETAKALQMDHPMCQHFDPKEMSIMDIQACALGTSNFPVVSGFVVHDADLGVGDGDGKMN